jgi:hypothetical protein
MNLSARKTYNAYFTEEKYHQFLADLNEGLREPIAFRVAETPVFLTEDFRDKLISAGNAIVDIILQPDFKALTERAIPEKWRVANENDHPHFIALDFGVCKDEAGNIVPKLIELQGFPSLYGFQVNLADTYRENFEIPADQSVHFSGLDKQSYIALLKRTIVGDNDPEEVVLMDVNAPEQKTAVDFYLTQKYIGTPVVSLSDLEQDGDKLFYKVNGGRKRIRRIYNRLIFDEIEGDTNLFDKIVDIRQSETQFLHQLKAIPADLDNYVLKPLFSFAGQGVIIDVSENDIQNIKDPENWILQQKVNYEPVVQAPDGGVKVEIRLLYLWPNGDEKPTLAINLARLSRGKMIGVRYNQNFDWVGGTIAFMPGIKDSKCRE